MGLAKLDTAIEKRVKEQYLFQVSVNKSRN